jgi:septum formation protein
MEIMQIMKDFKLILASGSPRRKFLLEGLGWTFEVRPTAIDEAPIALELPESCATRLAVEKSQACPWQRGEIVVGADTLVALSGRILNKPKDPYEAVEMLTDLSGQWHEVISGVAVRHGATVFSGHVTTKVQFRTLSRQEIQAYVATGEPLDKAGAYGIQGHGGALVAEMEGDYPNVVGLPMAHLLALLRKVTAQI